MLTTIALTALMTTSAQFGDVARAPLAEQPTVDVTLRPADGETIPRNARVVALPLYRGGAMNLNAELTVGADAAEQVDLTQRCTADGTLCLYEGPLEGLIEGTGSTLSLSGEVSRSEVYAVGPTDVTPPNLEFEAVAPRLQAVVNSEDEVDHYSLAFSINQLSFDSDVALLEVQEIFEDDTREPVFFAVFFAGDSHGTFEAPLSSKDGDGCVALLITDVAGNTTTVEGEVYCRKLSREEADEERILDEGNPDGSLGGSPLYCNHMGTEKTTPVGLGAVFFGLLALVRRRRRA